MTETPASSEPATAPVATSAPVDRPVEPAPAPERRQSRLTQAAALVGIVAGIVFIVAVVFGTGFMLGAHSGGHHHGGGGHDRHGMMMFHRGGPPPMGPGQRMFPPPGQFGPGGPFGQGGPGGSERQETPPTMAPARP
ncbi:hypothetical protein M1247_03560 [Mycobacterium sp. 21AC1]|uniref:hypothetical protein n=1 Tax=[Mycobacterium] appelbergii TaxID=2939269 RepID=UPI002938E7F7|nr:hypothetical protein [Mycobacterium sp. 21AC1]MDV3123981.1 hypothetical protein [Mycobacterium sp. 21AC1]